MVLIGSPIWIYNFWSKEETLATDGFNHNDSIMEIKKKMDEMPLLKQKFTPQKVKEKLKCDAKSSVMSPVKLCKSILAVNFEPKRSRKYSIKKRNVLYLKFWDMDNDCLKKMDDHGRREVVKGTIVDKCSNSDFKSGIAYWKRQSQSKKNWHVLYTIWRE